MEPKGKLQRGQGNGLRVSGPPWASPGGRPRAGQTGLFLVSGAGRQNGNMFVGQRRESNLRPAVLLLSFLSTSDPL